MARIDDLWILSTPVESLGESWEDFKLLFDVSRDHLLLQAEAVLSAQLPARALITWISPQQLWIDREAILARGLEQEAFLEAHYCDSAEIFEKISTALRLWQMN